MAHLHLFQMANRYGAGNNVQRGREISITLNQETIDASQTQVGQDYVRIYTAQNAPRGIHTLVISIAGSERLSTTRPCNNLAGTVHWTITIADQYETINGNDNTALSVFKPDELINATARTDTGLKYKRSIAACREIDVSLAPGSPDYLEIVRYAWTGVPSAVTALAPVRMEGTQSDHVQLFFKPQADTPADTTVTVTIQGKATGNAQLCAGFGNSPPDLVVWALTLGTSSWP
ncbi:MAG: hypothetical protein ISN28_10180, partial [Ectothiorhodospiraceae bacterium AqS1]|nr:hypothetical protein [Ectothiorhodospiraceae bacterium AqS1]